MNTNGNYYENRLRKRESFKRLINIGLSMICLLLEISLFAYMWQFHFQFQLVDPAAEDLVSWLSAGKRYLQRNPDIFLRDLRRHASGIHEKHGDHISPRCLQP